MQVQSTSICQWQDVLKCSLFKIILYKIALCVNTNISTRVRDQQCFFLRILCYMRIMGLMPLLIVKRYSVGLRLSCVETLVNDCQFPQLMQTDDEIVRPFNYRPIQETG